MSPTMNQMGGGINARGKFCSLLFFFLLYFRDTCVLQEFGFHCIFVSFHLGMYTDGVYILLTALHYSEWRHRGGSIAWLAGQTLWESWRGEHWRRAKRVYSTEKRSAYRFRPGGGGEFGFMMEWRESEERGIAAQDGWRVEGEMWNRHSSVVTITGGPFNSFFIILYLFFTIFLS